MRVADFDFDLPEENIALRPVVPRDNARLLVVDGSVEKFEQAYGDHNVGDLASFLKEGDALVFNDTKVIPAQLHGTRTRGESVAQVAVTLHMRMSGDRWRAFVRGAKKLKIGEQIVFKEDVLTAKVVEKTQGGEIELHFDRSGSALDAALVAVGHIPLPPYIASKRGDDAQDKVDYQTIYAEKEGAVAAPTAGLHFTDELFARLDAKNISRHFLTLHVGAGTFLPVKVDDTKDHKMHHENGVISEETAQALNQVRAQGGRIVAVGTTSLRLLESAVDDQGVLKAWSGSTDIFITPGYQFRAVDVLMTNFHLPRSTLFMLVSAFAGKKTMQSAYAHAIETGYRFYSYGDSSLLFKE